MKIRISFYLLGLFFMLSACNNASQNQQNEQAGILQEATDQGIIHSVIFNLKYPPDSEETQQFLSDGRRLLSSIPTVENFEVRREVSPKNDYSFGFSMVFADQAAYDAYNEHPVHVDFVTNRWEKEVTEFLEIDYVVLE